MLAARPSLDEPIPDSADVLLEQHVAELAEVAVGSSRLRWATRLAVIRSAPRRPGGYGEAATSGTRSTSPLRPNSPSPLGAAGLSSAPGRYSTVAWFVTLVTRPAIEIVRSLRASRRRVRCYTLRPASRPPAAALWVATRLVPGVSYSGGWLSFLAVAAVFGVVNAFIRPVAKILTFPLMAYCLPPADECSTGPQAASAA